MKMPSPMSSLTKTVVLTLVFFFLATPVFAQMKMEIFPLKHRQAVELVLVVEPLLGGVGSVTGIRNQLVVRTTPVNLAVVRSVLKKLDTASINLRITVREGTSLHLKENDAELSADARLGKKGQIAVSPGPSKSGGLIVAPSRKGAKVTGRIQQRDLRATGNNSQQVVTQDGQPAVIHITQTIPFTETEGVHSGKGSRHRESVVFQEVTRGFRILPRLQSDRVVMDISPVSSRFRGGVVASHGIHTTVSGRLGEWIELGSLSENSRSKNSQLLGRSETSTRESKRVFVKVEKEP